MKKVIKKAEAQKNIANQEKWKLAQSCGLTKQTLHTMLRNMLVSRRVDDTEISMRKQNHAYFQISGAGHEAILTALGYLLKPSYDYFLPYYRDRALCLALGVTPLEMLAQANGNLADTSSYGRQMPSHWGHKKLNIISKSSCTGTQFNQACGVAEAGRYLSSQNLPGAHKDEIVYCSTGDGTTSQGEFWEGLNTAIILKLPVLFLVEDNGYAISVPVKTQTPQGSISKALKNYPDLKIYTVNGSCPIESVAVGMEANDYLRSGKGPVLIHASVTRPYSHSLSDDHSFYRPQAEIEEEAQRDCLITFPKFLIDQKLMTQKELEEMKDSVKEEVLAAKEECLLQEKPALDSHSDHLYAAESLDHPKYDVPCPEDDGDTPMAMAINKVLKQEFQKNPLLRLFGEDVADFGNEELLDTELKGKGGVFKVTSGVQKVSKPGQVFNSPLAEANIIGRAIGQAVRGINCVVEIQFFDYIWPAFMQIKNELAMMSYRSGGDFTCPVVIRVPTGGYLKGGALYHSQTSPSTFTHIPGLLVAFPSNARDAAGLLRTAIRGDDPVIFLEHKHLYYQGHNRTGEFSEDFQIPFGKAKIVREGQDATIIAWGALVHKSLEAAKVLSKEGKSIEVIDARTLAPFDMETLKTSLAKTHRVLVAHEEIKTSGLAGEIAARINEECFEALDAPILRVTSKDTHVAYCPDLEEVILPQTNNVVESLRKLLSY